jgi:hypothetical protein
VHWDVWLERFVSHEDEAALIAAYGGKLVTVSVRPLRPQETKELSRRLRKQVRFEQTVSFGSDLRCAPC